MVAAEQNAAGYDVYRSYSEPGGIADELRATAAAHPAITKLVTIGRAVQGQPILALKVTKEPRHSRTANVRRSCTPERSTRASGSPPR